VAAAARGSAGVLNLLIAHRADINRTTNDNESVRARASMRACMRACVRARECARECARKLACAWQALFASAAGMQLHLDSVRTLLAHAADANVRSRRRGREGMSALRGLCQVRPRVPLECP
jgi:hypothetical protein